MAEPIALNTAGPHSPEYTAQVANALAEAVRVLNYATLGDAPGLEYPGDVYTLLGSLYTATGRLSQLLTQAAAFVKSQEPRLADANGDNVHVQVLLADSYLTGSASLAGHVTVLLQQAQNAISGLYLNGDTNG